MEVWILGIPVATYGASEEILLDTASKEQPRHVTVCILVKEIFNKIFFKHVIT